MNIMKNYILIILMSSTAIFSSCFDKNFSSGKENSIIAKEANDRANESKNINTRIDIYGWWWSSSQMEHNFNADNPPPKSEYVKLEKWNAASDNEFPHPDNIDIVTIVENKSKNTAHIKIHGKIDFKVVSYKELSTLKSEEEIAARLQTYPWKELHDIGKMDSIIVPAGGSQEVKFSNFNLRAILNKYLDSDNDDWTWKMRIQIIFYDKKGEEIFRENKILDMIPGD